MSPLAMQKKQTISLTKGLTKIIVGGLLCLAIFVLAVCLIDADKIKSYQEGWGLSGALQAVAQNPNEPNAHAALGSVYMRQKQYSQAIIEYQRLVRLAPQNPYSHLDLGKAFALAGLKAQSHHEWEQAIRLDVVSGHARQEAAELQKRDP